jgi:CheY-like chemotaxis protein
MDVTDRVAAERELVIAKEAAEAANRAKSTFLTNMSHEIRTPLNAILGFTQVLARDPDLNALQQDRLATIRRGGEHLLTLINDILDLAKIEAGRSSIQVAPFDLAAVVGEVGELFRPRADERGLILTIETPGLPRYVAGDALRVRQVLINLIGNAVKFTEAGGNVTLRIEAATDSAMHFSVSDTGIGIAPEEMVRLFEPFSQTASGRQTLGGTGLGLALCRNFVRMMGGELEATSTPARGSCFFFTIPLPATDASVPEADDAAAAVVGLEPDQPVCRVLIVDDQADNRAPLRAVLAGLNPDPPILEFREAADGREAVTVWEAWQPHIVFMDIRMPVLSGTDATRQIKTLMAEQPDSVRSSIVALSASAFEEHRAEFLAAGCDEFIRKPFVASEVFAILERRTRLAFRRVRDRPAPVATLSPEALAHHLAALGKEWRSGLIDAVALGDFKQIESLLKQIHDSDPLLYEMLAKWAYRYDLDSFSDALSTLSG